MELSTIKNTLSTDKQCREYLANFRWKNEGFTCPRCNSKEAWKTSEIKFKCKKCGYKMSVTAGTIFQDSHVSLDKWFYAIWLMSEYNEKLTADKLKKELQLGSNNTSLKMFRILKRAHLTSKFNKLIPTVEVKHEVCSFKGQGIPIIIAVEIKDDKTRQIRIERMSDLSKENILAFIERNVLPCDLVKNDPCSHKKIGILTPLLYSNDFGEQYDKLVKSPSYEYKHAKKVFSDFSCWMNNKCPKDQFDKGCKIYCALHNSKFASFSFEEILENLLKLKNKKSSTAK